MVVDFLGDVGEGIPEALAPLVVVGEGGAGGGLVGLVGLGALVAVSVLDGSVGVAAAAALVAVGQAVLLGEEAAALVVALAAPLGQVGSVGDALGHEGAQHAPAAVVHLRGLGHETGISELVASLLLGLDGEAAVLLVAVGALDLEGAVSALLGHVDLVFVGDVWGLLALPVDVDLAAVDEGVHERASRHVSVPVPRPHAVARVTHRPKRRAIILPPNHRRHQHQQELHPSFSLFTLGRCRNPSDSLSQVSLESHEAGE